MAFSVWVEHGLRILRTGEQRGNKSYEGEHLQMGYFWNGVCSA